MKPVRKADQARFPDLLLRPSIHVHLRKNGLRISDTTCASQAHDGHSKLAAQNAFPTASLPYLGIVQCRAGISCLSSLLPDAERACGLEELPQMLQLQPSSSGCVQTRHAYQSTMQPQAARDLEDWQPLVAVLSKPFVPTLLRAGSCSEGVQPASVCAGRCSSIETVSMSEGLPRRSGKRELLYSLIK